ncbi:MAG: arginyltransferase [Nitrospirae bacterium]|nr:arginyltransferase [Magnetococcales bacterium]HAT49057.1 arginyltransferase [Alphaproteobacteria bacterium]
MIWKKNWKTLVNHYAHPGDPLPLLLSPIHPCGYLPAQNSASLFVDPTWPMDPLQYGWLLEKGFRRSGSHVYRPYCTHCTECVPVRLPAKRFTLQRSLRRVLEKNTDLTVSCRPAFYNDERFELYCNYLEARHADGPMDTPEPKDFSDFLLCNWGHTQFVEFRQDRRLLAVAVVDVLPNALSAVYTFFDPEARQRSLGSLAVLWQVQHTIARKLSWLYLGYWIKDCRKMTYKSRFHPMEGYIRQEWKTIFS